MELCEGPFGPTAGCLSSPHMARWLLYTLTFSISPSIYFSFLFVAAVLIRRWIHAVLVLTPHSMSCETHTSDTANGAARETTREKNMPYCGQADMDTCVHSSFKTSDSECQTTHLAFFLQSFFCAWFLFNFVELAIFRGADCAYVKRGHLNPLV